MRFKTEPMSHQLHFLREHCEDASHALFWEQGTGKTKAIIDNAAQLFLLGKIDAVLVLAPGGVHENWRTDEIPAHLLNDVRRCSRGVVWNTGAKNAKWFQKEVKLLLEHEGLAWLFMTYDGIMTEEGRNFCKRFLLRRRVLYVVDEGHNIKTAAAKRTRRVVASGAYAPYRRLLTGTPSSGTPFDYYPQIKFLDDSFWRRELNLADHAAFKNEFGVWQRREDVKKATGWDPGYDQLISFKNEDVLKDLLKKISSRVLKEDVMDLPEKIYRKVYFEMTKLQRSIYEEVKEELIAVLDNGSTITAELAITKLLRLQQIALGYAPTDDEPLGMIDKKNPALDAAVDFCTQASGQGIVWCRFTKDIDLLMDALPRAVRYDGRVSQEDASRARAGFKAGDYQWFVGNTAKGREGLTLIGAKTTLYYSNSFKLIDRLQSEDRNHRRGQTQNVLYGDLVCHDTVLSHIANSLRSKFDIASNLNGDRLREWI